MLITIDIFGILRVFSQNGLKTCVEMKEMCAKWGTSWNNGKSWVLFYRKWNEWSNENNGSHGKNTQIVSLDWVPGTIL